MIAFIDVNAWVYLANPSSPFHGKVKKELVAYLSGEKEFAVSTQVFYEFIRVSTDPRYYEKPAPWEKAFAFISAVFNRPNAVRLAETQVHESALLHVLKVSGYVRGHFIHDCHIAALLYEHGIKTIITADQDFRRFDFLDVVNPTAV